MGEIWIKEAEQLHPLGTPGTMAGGAPKAIAHVTVSPSGGAWFSTMDRVLTSNRSEPHLLYDPLTDRLGQYFPLNVSARALVGGTGPVSTNKAGSVVIQIEFIANPIPAFTTYWKPGPNFRAMMRAIRSWGVPDVFPMGPCAASYGGKRRASFSTYQSRAGWYGHCDVPYNDHWDPGPIDQAAFFAAAAITKPKEWYEMPLDPQTAAQILALVEQGTQKTVGSWKITTNDTAVAPDANGVRWVNIGTYLGRFISRRADVGYARDQMLAAADPAKLADALAARMPAGNAPTAEELQAAILGAIATLTNPKE